MARNVPLLFLVAVVISAMYGGRGPGLLAALVSTIFVAASMRGPWVGVFLGSPQAANLGIFLILAVSVGWLNALRREAQQALWQARDELEQRVAERTSRLAQANERLRQETLDHQQTLRVFRESEARNAAIVETSLDCLITTDRSGRIIEFNGSAEQTFGYGRERAIGRVLAELILPAGLREALGRSFGDGSSGAALGPPVGGRIEIEAMRADGTVFPAELAIKRIEQDDAPIFSVSLRDITERKQWERELIEHQLRLRELAEQLLRSEERERRRLAGQLHDNIGQMLAVVKIELELLCQSDEAPDSVREALHHGRTLLDEAIMHTRSLTRDLSPPILYEGGLEAAVVWWCQQWSRKHSLVVDVAREGSWSGALDLDDELRGFFFQAIRELLVNVVKHARAMTVRITLGESDGRLWVGVKDDGIGLGGARHDAAAAAGSRDGGFGLFSIRERIGSYGGRLTIESAPGCGTSVRMEVPTGDFADSLRSKSKSRVEEETCKSGC